MASNLGPLSVEPQIAQDFSQAGLTREACAKCLVFEHRTIGALSQIRTTPLFRPIRSKRREVPQKQQYSPALSAWSDRGASETRPKATDPGQQN